MIEDITKAESPGYIYAPVDFEPSKYPGPIADHPDAARWLLNSIYFNRLLRNFSEDDPVNLNAKLLGLVMGDINKVRPVREALEERRLISCDHSYVKGHKSFSFTLGPALKGVGWERYRSGSKAFNNRVNSFKEYVRNPTGFDVAVHDHLEKWARLVEISPDLDFNRLDFPEEAKEQLAIHQVEMIRDRYIRLTVCPYGRFHSNYSGLCREIRPYLKINGFHLAEIDIVNSQPYFLSLILIQEFIHSQSLPNSPNQSYFTSITSLSHSSSSSPKERGTTTHPYDSVTKGLGDALEIPEDLMNLLKTCSEGKFYEDFANRSHWTREKVKRKIFQVIFGTTSLMEKSPIGLTFKQLYPTAYDLIVRLKKGKGYEWIGRELQRRESRSIINGVCERLREDHPEIPVVTVHDSLMVPDEDIPIVQAILHDHFSQFALPPSFKIKPAIETSQPGHGVETGIGWSGVDEENVHVQGRSGTWASCSSKAMGL